jgi:hypothetical protein
MRPRRRASIRAAQPPKRPRRAIAAEAAPAPERHRGRGDSSELARTVAMAEAAAWFGSAGCCESDFGGIPRGGAEARSAWRVPSSTFPTPGDAEASLGARWAGERRVAPQPRWPKPLGRLPRSSRSEAGEVNMEPCPTR